MGVVQRLKRIAGGAEDDPAAIERVLGELRAKIAQHQAEAEQLSLEWVSADSSDAAEQIDRRRREALRLAQRDTARLPVLEARLLAAKAEQLAAALARHRGIMRALFPRLQRAIEAAAAVQVEVISARNAAIAELGEGLVSQQLPPLVFLGFILPDLVALWSAEQARIWSAEPPRPPAAPRPQPEKPAPVKAISVAPAAPPPRRPLRQDPPPGEGECAIVFTRGGVELPDGAQAMVGDRLNVRVDEARTDLLRGAADYASKDRANA